MERKFSECGMDAVLSTCTSRRVDRDSYHNPIKNRREYGLVYIKNGETVAIIYYFKGPDGEDRRSIRQMVIEDIAYQITGQAE